MRKYRVWDTANKVMGIVNCYDFDEDKVFYTTDDGIKYSQVSGYFILEESTGLKDKNGKEIYEGDIILTNEVIGQGIGEDPRRSIMAVKQDSYNGGYRLTNPEIPQGNPAFCSLNTQHQEVIGNIHDNPKLLEGAK